MRAAKPESCSDVAVIALRYGERREGLTGWPDDCVVAGCEDAIKSGEIICLPARRRGSQLDVGNPLAELVDEWLSGVDDGRESNDYERGEFTAFS